LNVRIKLMRDGAKLPHRAHPTDAGADIFYCPVGHMPCLLHPGESNVIPTGVRAEVPAGYMLEVKNKSGIASKRQLVVGACVVDSGYDGEIFVNLHNIGRGTQVINPGEKVAQVVLVPIETCAFVETDGEINDSSSRGDGGFGSTGDS